MSHTGYDSRYHPRSRHDTYYTTSRDRDASAYAYPRHDPSSSAAHAKLTDMRYSVDKNSYYPPSPRTYDSYESSSPRRSAGYRSHRRKPTWPPSPSVEEEASDVGEGEPPADTRGTVDQEAILDDVEPPPAAHTHDDRRFVVPSDLNTEDDEDRLRTGHDHGRRRSVAERGNMAPIKTSMEEPPVFTERVSTPYAYTKPQKESVEPSPADFLRSPDPLTPSNSGILPSTPPRDRRASERDAKRPISSYSRHDSFSKAQSSPRNDVFDDSDLEADSSTHLRTERKPARYSFVKSDLQKEHLRTDMRDMEERPRSRRASGQQPALHRHDSSSSAKDYIYAQSPRSSSSSMHGGSRKARPAPVDTDITSSPRTYSRPSSPLPRAPSPRLPTRLRESPPTSRPSSRGNTRPASPLSFSTNVRPPSPRHESVTDADWHASYPPSIQGDRSRPPSRLGRQETIPEPAPRIDVHSPSPARPPQSQSSLPYPEDDSHSGIFMPLEHHYQFDHPTVDSPRKSYPDSPRLSSTPISGSPRLRDEPVHFSSPDATRPEEPSRTRKTRSNSLRSTTSDDGRREKPSRKSTPPNLQKPLPTCPRAMPSARYDEWYTLRGFSSFDICPTCFEGVFAGTEFAPDFMLRRREEKPKERYCDFNSPWMRLAWLLTVKQRRQTLNLLYRLIDIADEERPCPGDRELGTDRVTWYGIPEQRDGLRVESFAICGSDKKMIEALFPHLTGYFTKIYPSYRSTAGTKYLCSLRTNSRRFPKYLDLLFDIDAEAQEKGVRAGFMKKFVQLARDNAYKSECQRDKPLYRKPWHFIPEVPEFTVCEECYEKAVLPALLSSSSSSLSRSRRLERKMSPTIQFVPIENPDFGTSCCLYSSRMRRVWDDAVKHGDLEYLSRVAGERKMIEGRIIRRRREILERMKSFGDWERGSREWERCKAELREVEREWQAWE